jgi:hypothetical protein
LIRARSISFCWILGAITLTTLAGDFVLQLKHIAQVTVEPVGPQMHTACRLDQLSGNPYPAAGFAHAALKDISDAELEADLLDVDGLALVGEARIAGDHEQRLEAR